MPRKPPITILLLIITSTSFTQYSFVSTSLISKLNRISSTGGKEKYFGELYLQATVNAEKYIQSLPIDERLLMKRLEENFAEYFFQAIDANDNHEEIPASWKNYFNTNQLSPVQLKLLGANAHINGDIWQALVNTFSLEEIRKLQPVYKGYNRSICKVFDAFFESAIVIDKKLDDLHSLTLGFDKLCGKLMLKKWRNRQIKLAEFYFTRPEKFSRLKERVDKKKERTDRMIIARLR